MRRSNRRRRHRVLFTIALACTPVSAAATIAIAQTTKPRGVVSTKPKPVAPTKGDAPVPSSTSSATTLGEDAGDAGKGQGSPSGAASDAPVPPPSESVDGGRLSPLTPQPQELSSGAVDAGVPIDYDRLLADVAALRARVAAVSDNLYRSRIAVAVQTDGDKAKMGRFTVSLDDGVIFTAPPSFAASDMTPVYDHAVAPGRHAVTVDVDRKDTRDETFRTSQRTRFTVDVPRDNKVVVQVKILDDSSMGADFPSDRSGAYDLRFRVKAVAKPVGK